MAELAVGTLIGAKYEILGQLGVGGMGIVYEALHREIKRKVAIKVLHADKANSKLDCQRFLNEALAVNKIEHPSVVQISDNGYLDDGSMYLVMEFLKGEDLEKRVKRQGRPFSEQETATIGWQVASVLADAHKVGIIHRDLKPSNVMIIADQTMSHGERVKLLDFGIAKISSTTKLTQQGMTQGTPEYMSPEQCRGTEVLDDKVDVYAMGVLLYEMLALQAPFTNDAVLYVATQTWAL